MAFPCIAFIILFSYVPLYGWIYSFFEYKPGIPLSHTPFVGLKFFKMAIEDPQMINSVINTLAMNFLGILTLPASAIFAIMLNEMNSKRYSKIVQISITLPNFMSYVIIYSVFFLFFAPGDGIINTVLTNLGLIKTPTDILANSDLVWFFQTAVRLWKEVGFGTIIYLAAIAGIDPEIYNAADVDGAGRLRKIIHITIPELIPTYIILLILSIGAFVSSNFEQYYVFFNPLIQDKIQVIDYYVFSIGILNNDYAYATAIGMAKTLVSVILIFSANKIAKSVRGQSII